MSKARHYFWQYSAATIIGSFALLMPTVVIADTIRIFEFRPTATNLKQSDFPSLSSCIPEEPHLINGSVVYTNHYTLTTYTGVDQPRKQLGIGTQTYETVWFCAKNQVDKKILDIKDRGDFNVFERNVAWAIGSYTAVLATIAAWIIWTTSRLLAPLLGVGSFITNPMVTTGWPFVQGIANIGFLIALLFIAFATTLQLESFGARRMLPRLLIAALLINFSLVITGLLIDVSRLVMAALIAVISRNNLDNLGYNILNSSHLIRLTYNLQTFQRFGIATFIGSIDSWQAVASMLEALVLMWGLAVALIILIAGLFARYIMLVLLLIASPLAFLAVALPNTGHLAQKWWSTFMKYVLYGPIAAFILVLTIAASQGLAAGVRISDDAQLGFLANLLNLLLVIAMMIAAATAGSKLGVMGAGAALNFVKSVPGFVRRNPKTAAALAGVATGGLGWAGLAGAAGGALAVRAGQGAYGQGRDFAKPVTKALRKGIQNNRIPFFNKIPGMATVGKLAFGPERDEKGNLLKGETSLGQRKGRGLAAWSGLYPKESMYSKWEDDLRSAGTAAGAVRTDPAYSRLNMPRVGTAMSKDQGKAVLETAKEGHATELIQDFDRLRVMVSNPYAYNNLSDDVRAEIGTMNITTVVKDINLKRAARGEAAITATEENRLDRLVRDIKSGSERSLAQVIQPDWV